LSVNCRQLSHIPAPQCIVHLGAGLCRDLQKYVKFGARQILLLEPNPQLEPELRRRSTAHRNVKVLPLAVSTEAGQRTFKLYNYPEFSSLRRPTGLFELLPGLQQTGETVVEVIAAHRIFEYLDSENGDDNWLVIDTPGEEASVIMDLDRHNKLHRFNRIIIRVGRESLYEDAVAADELVRELECRGYFNEGASDTSSDPDWPRFHLKLNAKALECRRLRMENEKLEERLREREHRIERIQAELTKIQEKASAEEKAFRKERDELKKQLEQTSLGAEEYSELKSLVRNMESSIRRDVRQSRDQIESYMALNKYLEYGELAPSFNGWAISPDLAMQIVKALEENDYDLVIEFGSGSSTVLISQVMQQHASHTSQFGRIINHLAYDGEVSNEKYTVVSATEQAVKAAKELPSRIIAFEHVWKYLENTRQMLERSGVDQFVNLVHAPLQEYSNQDSTYLFYDCRDELIRAAGSLQKERARILILVDGPPGNTNEHARYPALPFLLESFAGHHLDIFLDDYDRKDEVEIVEMWIDELKKRSIDFEGESLDLAKGGYFLRLT